MNRTRFSFSERDLLPDADAGVLKLQALDGERSSGLALGLGITDDCNLKCPFCYYRQDGSPGKHAAMTPEFLERLLAGLGRVGVIMVGLEGEPLCHPDFGTMMEICSRHADSTVLITNGLLLSPDKVRVLNELRVSAVILSCDAVTPETYARLRPGGSLERFSENAKYLAAMCHARISVHSVVSDINWPELRAMPGFARSLGISRLSMTQLRNNEWSRLNGIRRASPAVIREFTAAVCREAEKCGTVIAFDYLYTPPGDRDWMRETVADFRSAEADLSPACAAPWTGVSVLSDGRVFPCCGDIEPVMPESLTFDGIFNCKALLKLRHMLSGQEVPEVCRKCLSGGQP